MCILLDGVKHWMSSLLDGVKNSICILLDGVKHWMSILLGGVKNSMCILLDVVKHWMCTWTSMDILHVFSILYTNEYSHK